ncbi:MAG: septal ring lytic transglycosylase RlpA family protein [Betaproteobacteria bacterium]|nr:septal ring lytic transglycosylase RlpA family protein [Betaproteobacteria bacterium]
MRNLADRVYFALAACWLCAGLAAWAPAQADALSGVHRTEVGRATYYGQAFQGKTTASGIPFNKHTLVAAHPTYPFGTVLRVTNLRNHRHVDVRVVDRGPALFARARGVIIDLSHAAARKLGFLHRGWTRVRLEVVHWGSGADMATVGAPAGGHS